MLTPIPSFEGANQQLGRIELVVPGWVSGFFTGGAVEVVTEPPMQNSAEFAFDISGFKDLSIALDFAAMGNFVDSHTFSVDYEIDGGGFTTAFLGSVVTGAMQSYAMDVGTPISLSNPYAINGTILNDDFQMLGANLVGTGSTLTVRATGSFFGARAIGFDNLTIRGTAVPEPTTLSLLCLASLVAFVRRPWSIWKTVTAA